MRFRTKVDLWILALLTLIPLGALVVVAVAGETGVLAVMLAVWVAIGFVILPCDYTLTEDALIVRSGLVRWRIPYSEIQRVYPTRNPLSSPAWSLDRLAVVYGKRWVMISPGDKVQFLTGLMKQAGLRQSGEELVRAEE
jgi:hypothetical protein